MFSLILGFAAVWHIWWAVIAGFVGIVVTAVVHSFGKNEGFYIKAAKVRAIEEAHYAARMSLERKRAGDTDQYEVAESN